MHRHKTELKIATTIPPYMQLLAVIRYYQSIWPLAYIKPCADDSTYIYCSIDSERDWARVGRTYKNEDDRVFVVAKQGECLICYDGWVDEQAIRDSFDTYSRIVGNELLKDATTQQRGFQDSSSAEVKPLDLEPGHYMSLAIDMRKYLDDAKDTLVALIEEKEFEEAYRLAIEIQETSAWHRAFAEMMKAKPAKKHETNN